MHINGDPLGRSRRLVSGVADRVSWPFERAAWALERRVLWPSQRRLAGRRRPGRRAGAVALGTVGVAAILAVALTGPGGGTPREQPAAPARVAIAPPAEPQPQASEPHAPTLHGAAPHFGVGAGVGVSNRQEGEGDGSDAEASSDTSGSETSAPEQSGVPAGEAAASASTAGKPVPAGPAAMQVAHRFADAFVFYEIGEKKARATAVFGETATEQLAEALDERPPRLPSNAKVPKAKVLNLVPGPRFGKQYTVSVSLLRVGVTSELRITLQKEKDGEWRVAQILG